MKGRKINERMGDHEQVLIRCRRMRLRGKDPAAFEIVVPPLAIDQPTPTCHTKGQTETFSHQSGTTDAIYDHSGRTSQVPRRGGLTTRADFGCWPTPMETVRAGHQNGVLKCTDNRSVMPITSHARTVDLG